jgi:alanine racemase
MPAARLTIDLDALAANYHTFRRKAPGAEVAPVVKADAYGLGAGPVARRLWAEGARSFYVARLEEGERLRVALGEGRPATIYVLDGAPTGSARRLLAARLTPILSSASQVETYAAAAGQGAPLPCGLHVDTGMNRLGLRAEQAKALAEAPRRLDRLSVDLVISHLACAEAPDHPLNRVQADRLRAAARLFAGARLSLANSAGVWLGPDYAFDMVRPGIGLYGGGPQGHADGEIRPVATVQAPILDVRTVPPGETIGYGASFTALAPLRIAVIAAGYADGVLRSSSPGGAVWIAGRRRPLRGRVSMDLIAADVTGCDEARPGDMAELIGPNLLLDDAADAAGTVSYELLTRLSPRLDRVYLGEA